MNSFGQAKSFMFVLLLSKSLSRDLFAISSYSYFKLEWQKNA